MIVLTICQIECYWKKIEISAHYSLPHGKQGSFVQIYPYLSIIVFAT